MKKLIALSFVFSAAMFAESFNGVLVDKMCSGKADLEPHTTACALKCKDSGYGLKTADGKFMKFDEAGSAKALALLKETSKKDHLNATVTGKADGDMITVESISLD